MKERRSLIEGLKPDPELQKLEEEFVFGAKRKPESAATVAPETEALELTDTDPVATQLPVIQSSNRILPQMMGRVPVTTRCRPEVASALKRASLQRQLAGAEPYHMQEILEVALEAWLHKHGYLQLLIKN